MNICQKDLHSCVLHSIPTFCGIGVQQNEIEKSTHACSLSATVSVTVLLEFHTSAPKGGISKRCLLQALAP